MATLLEIRTQAKDRADMANSTFVSDAEWNRYINAAAKELYDLLVSAYGDDYYLATSTLSIVSNTEDYDLPADFYKLRGVDLILSNERSYSLKPFNFAERNRYKNGNLSWIFNRDTNVRYRIFKDKIKFLPIPTGTYDIKLWYIPSMTELAGDSDEFDGINGWEDYIVVDAAIRALVKEESDVSALYAEKQKLLDRVRTLAPNRDAGESYTVTDSSKDGLDEDLAYFGGQWLS